MYVECVGDGGADLPPMLAPASRGAGDLEALFAELYLPATVFFNFPCAARAAALCTRAYDHCMLGPFVGKCCWGKYSKYC